MTAAAAASGPGRRAARAWAAPTRLSTDSELRRRVQCRGRPGGSESARSPGRPRRVAVAACGQWSGDSATQARIFAMQFEMRLHLKLNQQWESSISNFQSVSAAGSSTLLAPSGARHATSKLAI